MRMEEMIKIAGEKKIKDWKELEWGNISGSGDSRFLGPKGDSGDIKFDGGGNTYKITVDIKAGVYTIVQQ